MGQPVSVDELQGHEENADVLVLATTVVAENP